MMIYQVFVLKNISINMDRVLNGYGAVGFFFLVIINVLL
jgi:hypothetical protein